jgi:hypothetical protein
MLQIIQTIYDASGALRRREHLPLMFPDRETAALFLETHLEHQFADGRSGYEQEEDSWWGCDRGAELRIHRYMIEEPCDA